MTKKNPNSITFGAECLTIEDVVAISQGAKASMNSSNEFTSKIDRGVAFLERLLKEEGVIYGVHRFNILRIDTVEQCFELSDLVAC